MAIENYLCETCAKLSVCKINDILCKFDNDAKKNLGVDLTIDLCDNYDKVDE
jgi:hypothetical protein